jgi:hypothetical protein
MAITISTEGISDQQKATAKFQFTYRGMMAQQSSPGFIPVLCAHEAAHLVYFGFAGVTNYKAFPVRITYDPKADDFVGSLASVQILDIPKIKGEEILGSDVQSSLRLRGWRSYRPKTDGLIGWWR